MSCLVYRPLLESELFFRPALSSGVKSKKYSRLLGVWRDAKTGALGLHEPLWFEVHRMVIWSHLWPYNQKCIQASILLLFVASISWCTFCHLLSPSLIVYPLNARIIATHFQLLPLSTSIYLSMRWCLLLAVAIVATNPPLRLSLLLLDPTTFILLSFAHVVHKLHYTVPSAAPNVTFVTYFGR